MFNAEYEFRSNIILIINNILKDYDLIINTIDIVYIPNVIVIIYSTKLMGNDITLT